MDSNKKDKSIPRYEFFQGITFKLMGDERPVCVNPRPDTEWKTDKVKRKEWLRKLRKFKATLKSYYRMGALQSMIQSMLQSMIESEEFCSSPRYLYRNKGDLCELLLDQMEEETITISFIAQVLGHMRFRTTAPPCGKDIHDFICYALNYNSRTLRMKLGVIYV